jgi:hypothetical protein
MERRGRGGKERGGGRERGKGIIYTICPSLPKFLDNPLTRRATHVLRCGDDTRRVCNHSRPDPPPNPFDTAQNVTLTVLPITYNYGIVVSILQYLSWAQLLRDRRVLGS